MKEVRKNRSQEVKQISSLHTLAPCGRAKLRTDGVERVRMASRLSLLLRSNFGETLRAWSNLKTGQGEGLCGLPRSLRSLAMTLPCHAEFISASRNCEILSLRLRLRGQGHKAHYVAPVPFVKQVQDDMVCKGQSDVQDDMKGRHCERSAAIQTETAPTSILPHKGGSITPSLMREGWDGCRLKTHTKSSKKAAFTLAEVFLSHFAGRRKIAFTLAEVLITLGIIGIVAAMTLPMLIANHKKQVVVTRLKHFSSTWQQAIRMAEVEHGDTTYWEGFTPENPDAMLDSYNKYLAKYIKTVDTYKTPKGVAFELANGSGFHYRKAANAETWRGNLYLTFCVHYKSCKEIRDNVSASHAPDGKEKFHFNEIGKIVQWMGSPNNAYDRDAIRENCRTSHYLCTRLIEYDGWKISDDYPIKF